MTNCKTPRKRGHPPHEPTKATRDTVRLHAIVGTRHEMIAQVLQIDVKTLYKYYHDSYRLDKETGIEQGYEEAGTLIPPEDKDNGIAITYANMAFGQAFTASALQMGAALSAIVNGGNYYQPHLVASKALVSGETEKTPLKVLRKNVVSDRTSKDMIHLLDINTKDHIARWPYMKFQDGYVVGGKTGTAQIPVPGGYDPKWTIASFGGYFPAEKPQYVILVKIDRPQKSPWGSQVASPIFAAVAQQIAQLTGLPPDDIRKALTK